MNLRNSRRVLAVVGLCVLADCGGAAEAATYRSVLVEGVPHVKQKPDFCGEACAEMVLRRLGRPLGQDFVFDQSGLDPAAGRGCYTRELKVALERIGFRVGPVWQSVAVDDAARQMEAQFKALHDDLLEGVPSIVCMHYDDRPQTTEHFRLALGYDAKTDEVIYHEPAVPDGSHRRMKRGEWIKLWPLKYDKRRWTVVRLRLEPGRLTTARPAAGLTDADYAQHVLQLKSKLPEGFHLVVQKPFVVVGDESEEMVRRRATGTVKWSVDRLKDLYFTEDPDHIIDIWLFKDKESYRKHTWELLGDRPGTPFGYYSPRQQALIMNIATGGGTLVHEIVHPFVAANFPDCPAWFNEGLGSLYEQSGQRNGRIVGLTNWRLAGLQEAIAEKRVPPFKTLCSTTSDEFYNHDKGTNYAQARYLCLYLQKRDLLVKFYHAFRRRAPRDPGGYHTLVGVLGEDDMLAFQKRWEAWVMQLKFR